MEARNDDKCDDRYSVARLKTASIALVYMLIHLVKDCCDAEERACPKEALKGD